jgi:hypothetical protein
VSEVFATLVKTDIMPRNIKKLKRDRHE